MGPWNGRMPDEMEKVRLGNYLRIRLGNYLRIRLEGLPRNSHGGTEKYRGKISMGTAGVLDHVPADFGFQRYRNISGLGKAICVRKV
jgi:hypothetical protein